MVLNTPSREAVLAAGLDAVEEAVEVIDPERMAYLHVNAACARLHGLPLALILQKGLSWVTARWHTATQAQLRQSYQQLIQQHPQATTRLHDVPGEGATSRWIEVTSRATRVEGRWLIVVVSRDTTAHRQREQRLQMLDAVLNDAPDSMLVIDPQSLEFLDANDAAAVLHGHHNREELLRLGLDRQRQALGLWSQDDLRQRYRSLIDNYPRTASERFPWPGDKTVELRRRAVRLDDQWLIVSVLRDVTDGRATERKIQQLYAAVNQAVDAIFVIDPDTMTYVDVNESGARLYGTTREHLVGAPVESLMTRLDLYPPGTMRERLQALIAQAPEPTVENLTLKLPDGRRTIVETTRRAVQIDGTWLVLVISRDVTERERASQELAAHAAELARSNRELEQFASVTSHDLSEPLRMVASFTQLLERRHGHQMDDEGREFMGYIVSGAQRMMQLIDDLLVYSRAGRAGAPMLLDSLDLALEDALHNLARATLDSQAVIQRLTPLPTLRYERTGMTQVFQNLLSNALKFRRTEVPVIISIAAQRSEAGWTVCVTDNGIGVDPEYVDRIFVIFQRLHTREQYEGTGIGLAICEKIVERHGGRIWVEAAPGGGACFKFTLPERAAPAPAAS